MCYGQIAAEPLCCRHALGVYDRKPAQRGRGALGDGLWFRHKGFSSPKGGGRNFPPQIIVGSVAL